MRTMKEQTSDAVKATGVDVKVEVKGVSIGVASLLTDGTWELHPEPVESSHWMYVENANAVVYTLFELFTHRRNAGERLGESYRVSSKAE